MTEQEIIINGNFLAHGNYEIRIDGTIINSKGKKLNLHKNTNGYINLNAFHKSHAKSFLVHRLVAMAYLPNPDKLPEVNHKDGNKANNHISNLEWVSRSENIKHGIRTGLIKKSMIGRTGSKHFKSKAVIATDNFGFKTTYESTGDAARKTGFNAHAIQDACKGKLKTYKSLTWKYQQ